MYNEHLQVLGSGFVSKPEHIETGLDRELGSGTSRNEMLESDEKYNIADILVDQELWDSQPYTPENVRNSMGWYPVDFRGEENDISYQGFIRPVEDLGWDVVLQTLESSELQGGASAEISVGTPESIGVQSPEIGSGTSDYEPEKKNYFGFFLPYGS